MLKVNLQFFAEDETADTLDFDSMLEEFESEWEGETEGQESDTEVEEGPESEEPEQEEEQPEEVEQEEETQQNPNDPDEDKRNRAFADLRRQADENRKYAEFISQIAKDAGVNPDDLMKQYQERIMQQEAEQKGIPLDFYREQSETKQRLAQLEDRYRFERLDMQIESVRSKYGANEDSVREAFQYMLNSGVDPRVQDNVDFERFYRAANLDSIIQREVEQARQQDLASKKSRQQSAAIGNGTSVSQSNPNDISDEEVDAILKRMDIKI